MSKPQLHFQRYEFKYFLPKQTADKILPALLGYMDFDPYIKNSGRDYYSVNSLYFDSPGFDCYWDKEAGVSRRKKLRYRFYGDNLDSGQPVFLEIKRKDDALIYKDRIMLPVEDCQEHKIDQILYEWRQRGENNEFYDELSLFRKRNSLRPKLFLSYKRRALVGKAHPRFRVTFDYDIAAKPASSLGQLNGNCQAVYPDGVVLELKYNNLLPLWFRDLIQKYQLQRVAFSKYCNALRTVVPALDDNNYSPN